MPAYAKTKISRRSDGQYHRTIGRVLSATGPSKPKRFLLGKEKSRAKSAAAALEALWEDIENFYAQSLGPDDEPVWTHDTLQFAEAIRGNEPIVVEDDDDNSELNLA